MFRWARWGTIKKVFRAGVAHGVSWEHVAEAPHVLAVADTLFSPKELTRLGALRERYQATKQCIEMDLDERRLRFARWLVEHGCIDEGIAGS